MSGLVIHIGFDKTGTTSVQRFLRDHQRQLAGMGFVYDVPSRTAYPYSELNHEVLTSLLSGEQIPSDTLDTFGSHENARLVASRWARGIKSMNLSRTSTIIISSEALYSLAMPAVRELRDVSRWITNTANFEDGLRILAYVSEPASRYRRAASESILSGRRFRRPRDQAARQYMEQYLQWFGREHVLVRAYDRDQLVNGSVIDDVLDHLRPRPWDNAALKKSAVEENRSPSSEALLLCSVLRELGLYGKAQWEVLVAEVILFDRAVAGRRTASLTASVHDYLIGSSPDYDWLHAEFGCEFNWAGARRPSPGYDPDRRLSMMDIFNVNLDRYRQLAAYYLRHSLVLGQSSGVDLLGKDLISAPCTSD